MVLLTKKTDNDMNKITLISGSTLGSAEYVAEHLEQLLKEQGFSTQLFHGPELNELPLSGIWLVISSTHGAGELPDNLKPLFEQLAEQNTDLNQIQFGAIGLGNKEYDIFCGAIKTAEQILTKQGAIKIGETSLIDVTEHEIPEDPAEQWLNEWIKLFN